MKRSNLSFVAFIFLAAAACSAEGGPGGSHDPAPGMAPVATLQRGHAEVARASLAILHDLVQSDNPALRGFQSAEEVSTSTLAEPMRMSMIGLKPLSAYRAGDDPRVLFVDQDAAIYPITVAGDVRSSVIVEKRNGTWEASTFGKAKLARASVAVRQRVRTNRSVSKGDVSLVEIPALSLRMLSHEEGGVAMLTPLEDVHGTDLRAGETSPAGDVLAKLAPLALQNAE